MTHVYPPPAKPPISRGDLVASIVALLLTLGGGIVAAFLGFFMMAFTDYCPPATCHVEAGLTAMAVGFVVAAILGVAGTVITIIRLTKRAPAWPVALGTLGVCAIACVASIAAYIAAVGG